MNESLLVRGRKPVGDLRPDLERFVGLERPTLEASPERLAVQELHHEVVGVPFAADVVEGADVRVVERRDRARFSLEPLAHLGVVGKMRREDFHRDVAPEARVLGAVDLAHPARAERAENLVGT